MRHSDEDNGGEQLLFDLPLDPKAAARAAMPEPRRAVNPEPRPAAPLRPRPEPVRAPEPPPAFFAEDGAEDFEDSEEETPAGDPRVGVGNRLAAGAADLLMHGAVIILLLVGSRSLGVRPTLEDVPAFGVFLLVFSFLYTVVPLAFWGHTLGMAWAGLTSQNRNGEPLTFDQTARRWFGGVLTVATAGLPLLAALRGRSLADLLSGSTTERSAG
jgi:uncharacterized RDD family membrane protein YckC